MPGRAGLDLALNAAKALREQLAQVPARAVGAEEPEVVDVRVAALMRLSHIDRVHLIQPVFLGERLANVIVQAVHALLHVGVFLDLPVLIV